MAVVVVAITLACYWPSLHGLQLWDDPAHVTHPDLRSWAGLLRILFEPGATQEFYPVLHGAFWLEHRLWGDAVLGYHLLNIVLHAGSCCLLALALRQLWFAVPPSTATPQVPVRLPPPRTEWLAALLFAVHPVSVESVAWITEQKNTLSAFFYLLAALAYLKFTVSGRRLTYAAALVAFLFALGAKTATVTLPAALLVVAWWRHGRLAWHRDVRPLLPWFLIAFAAGLLTIWVERTLVGADGEPFALSGLQRVLLAARIVWFYLEKLVWPSGLVFFYPRWDVAAAMSSWWIWLAVSLVVTLALWILRRRMRGPLAAWLLFVGSLFPVLGFFNVYGFLFSQVADHFQYMGCLTFAGATAAGLGFALARIPALVRKGTLAACGLALIALAVLSHRQSGLYRDNETLFGTTVARNPDSWMAHHILASTLAKFPGRQAEAIVHYEQAIRLNPTYPDPHVGLAVELARLPGRAPGAIAHYEEALRLRPHYIEAHHNLAVELLRVPGRLADAVAHEEAALRLRPNFPEAHLTLARAFAQLPDRTADAIIQAEAALQWRPGYGDAHALLANLLAATPENRAGAIAHYEAALANGSESAGLQFNFANTLAALPGRMPDAVRHYEAALRLDPDFAEAHANLANALAQSPGDSPAALAHYETALQLNPKLAWVHHNLALLLARLPDRFNDVIAHCQTALQLDPRYLEAYNTLAILFAQQGRLHDARAQWEAALHVDPRYETARKNLQLLDQVKSR